MALVVEQAAKDPEVLVSNPTFYPLYFPLQLSALSMIGIRKLDSVFDITNFKVIFFSVEMRLCCKCTTCRLLMANVQEKIIRFNAFQLPFIAIHVVTNLSNH